MFRPLAHHAGGLVRPLPQQPPAGGCLLGAIGGAELEQRGLVDGGDQALLAAEMVDDERG